MNGVESRMRLAVAEDEAESVLAPRLGRAVRFALFDVAGSEVRGPFYRVRHDNPGVICDDHSELTALLYDCQLVIAGSVGERMARRLLERGIEVVVTPERKPAAQLVARYLVASEARAHRERRRAVRRTKLRDATRGSFRPRAIPSVLSISHRIRRLPKAQFVSVLNRLPKAANMSNRLITQSPWANPLAAT